MSAGRPRTAAPDPFDPANDPWWRLHDALDAIASDAARITRAASAARARLRAGSDPQLDDLAEALDRWLWDRRTLGQDAGRVQRHSRPDPGNAR